jgi:hypothetical protein
VSSYEKVDAVGAGEYARRQSKESSTGREKDGKVRKHPEGSARKVHPSPRRR